MKRAACILLTVLFALTPLSVCAEEINKEQAMLGDSFERALDTEIKTGTRADTQRQEQLESERNEEGAETPGEAAETL